VRVVAFARRMRLKRRRHPACRLFVRRHAFQIEGVDHASLQMRLERGENYALALQRAHTSKSWRYHNHMPVIAATVQVRGYNLRSGDYGFDLTCHPRGIDHATAKPAHFKALPRLPSANRY